MTLRVRVLRPREAVFARALACGLRAAIIADTWREGRSLRPMWPTSDALGGPRTSAAGSQS